MSTQATTAVRTQLDHGKKVHSEILGVERLEFDDSVRDEKRTKAETEAMRDYQKPIRQLLADVHEEAMSQSDPIGRIAGSFKRMSALVCRASEANEAAAASNAAAAESNARVGKVVMWLTAAMTLLVVIQVIIAVIALR